MIDAGHTTEVDRQSRVGFEHGWNDTIIEYRIDDRDAVRRSTCGVVVDADEKYGEAISGRRKGGLFESQVRVQPQSNYTIKLTSKE